MGKRSRGVMAALFMLGGHSSRRCCGAVLAHSRRCFVPSRWASRRSFGTCAAAGHADVPQVASPTQMTNIYTLGEEELATILHARMGVPKYRAKQIRKWLYEKGCHNFEEMQDLPKDLRARLAEGFTLGCMDVALEQRSKDGTVKRAYRLGDNQLIESVLMPYEDGRRTACISSQAGCAMGCVFCATGQMGFARQLSDTEIFEQALLFSQELAQRNERLSNVVFMGMGEPLANLKNVMKAVKRLNTELGIGVRHITISTVGLPPKIRALADEGIQVKLAVSLHAANDAARGSLMPVNRRFPLEELMDACEYYVQKTGRRMTFEYALIAGQNDNPETAHELGRLLSPRLKGLCHVNTIPVNPTGGFSGKPSSTAATNKFLAILNERYGVPATVRVRRGIDIDAGCGQLKSKVLKG